MGRIQCKILYEESCTITNKRPRSAACCNRYVRLLIGSTFEGGCTKSSLMPLGHSLSTTLLPFRSLKGFFLLTAVCRDHFMSCNTEFPAYCVSRSGYSAALPPLNRFFLLTALPHNHFRCCNTEFPAYRVAAVDTAALCLQVVRLTPADSMR